MLLWLGGNGDFVLWVKWFNFQSFVKVIINESLQIKKTKE
jgi:hypothetical protein